MTQPIDIETPVLQTQMDVTCVLGHVARPSHQGVTQNPYGCNDINIALLQRFYEYRIYNNLNANAPFAGLLYQEHPVWPVA